MRRIGAAQARRYFLTAETIKSDVAQQIGLVHEVVKSADDLAELEAHFKRHILNNSPAGIKASKELIDAVAGQPITSELIGTTQHAWVRGGGVGCSRSLGVLIHGAVRGRAEDTAVRLCDARASEEGIEGLTAFFEKRKASWIP